MLQVLDSLTKEPPTEVEVTRARTRLLKGFEMSLKRSDSLGLRLSESIALGDWRLAFYERDELEKVSVADVARVAATYFKPSNRTIGLFIPETNADRAVIPEAPDLTAMLKDYKGRPPIAQGEDFEASPANIEKRTTRGATEQGLKYAFLPKKTRGESVTATLTLRFGNLETLQNKAVIAEYTASMLNKGTRQKSHQQIKDLLDRLKARVSIGGGASSVTASVDTDREHLPEVLRLVREMLREPSFPVDEFEKMKQESLAALEQQRTDPQALAGILFARLSRPYYTAGRSALHADGRRGNRGDQGADAGATPGISSRLLWGESRDRRHRRRLRPKDGGATVARFFRQLDQSGAVSSGSVKITATCRAKRRRS